MLIKLIDKTTVWERVDLQQYNNEQRQHWPRTTSWLDALSVPNLLNTLQTYSPASSELAFCNGKVTTLKLLLPSDSLIDSLIDWVVDELIEYFPGTYWKLIVNLEVFQVSTAVFRGPKASTYLMCLWRLYHACYSSREIFTCSSLNLLQEQASSWCEVNSCT